MIQYSDEWYVRSSWLPFYNIVFQDLVESVKELVAEQKRFMKETELNQKRFHGQMLKIRKLEKPEFLNIWAAHLKVNVTGAEEAVNSEVGLRPLMWKNKNLMELYASEKPSSLAENLVENWSEREKCLNWFLWSLVKTAPERIPEVRVTTSGTNYSKVSSV